MSSTRMPFSGPGAGWELSLSPADGFMVWSLGGGRGAGGANGVRGRRPGPAPAGRSRRTGLPGESFELVRCGGVLVGVGAGEVHRAGDIAGQLVDRQRGG